MRRNPVLAALLSLIVPGLGQIYLGHSERGAAILAAAIVIGNLNILFLLGFFEASPDPATIWAYWIPRIVHDVISVWSIVFWAWTVFDAYTLKGKE